MRRRSKIGLLLIAACVIAGVVLLWPRMPRRAAEVLDGADRYELLSLDPQRPELPSPEHFHGFRVLGQTTVDRAAQSRLNSALRCGVESVFANLPKCFNPRHGIRVTRAGQTTDFVICFECQKVQVWQGDQRVSSWPPDASPQPAFDEVLRQAKVPLPKSE